MIGPVGLPVLTTEAGLILRDPAIRRRAILGVSVMILAFSAGHIMQNVLARDTNLAVRGLTPDAGPVVHEGTRAPGLPVPPAATLTPFQAPDFTPGDRITDDPPLPELPLEDASAVPMGAPCRITVDASAGDAGVIWLEVAAPCLPEQTVNVAQDGMHVDWRLDANGRLSADLPALSVAPSVTLRFADGSVETVSLPMPDVRNVSRVALTWDGPQILGLNALEYDAAYGGAGHVHSGAPGQVETDGSRGFLMQLGDGSGAMAQVYTFPRSDSSRRGAVHLSAEAEVTSETCGRLTVATAIQTDAFGDLMKRDVTLSMPSCDNLGDIVSLTTLFREIRLAAR
jgi:hypothetical protein